ncbi:nectin-3-like protein, partial [Clarias magur]
IPVVVPVITEAAEIYECVHSGDPATSNYTWFRQNSSSLPEGIKAEGNRLHFLQATSHLNGLYGCVVTNDKGTFVASLYRERQEGILEK